MKITPDDIDKWLRRYVRERDAAVGDALKPTPASVEQFQAMARQALAADPPPLTNPEALLLQYRHHCDAEAKRIPPPHPANVRQLLKTVRETPALQPRTVRAEGLLRRLFRGSSGEAQSGQRLLWSAAVAGAVAIIVLLCALWSERSQPANWTATIALGLSADIPRAGNGPSKLALVDDFKSVPSLGQQAPPIPTQPPSLPASADFALEIGSDFKTFRLTGRKSVCIGSLARQSEQALEDGSAYVSIYTGSARGTNRAGEPMIVELTEVRILSEFRRPARKTEDVSALVINWQLRIGDRIEVLPKLVK